MKILLFIIAFALGMLTTIIIFAVTKPKQDTEWLTTTSELEPCPYYIEIESADEVDPLTEDIEIYIHHNYMIEKWLYRASNKSLTLIDKIEE